MKGGMKGLAFLGGIAALTLAAPALAGYKLMPAGKTQPVGKLGLSVTPPNDWNRLGAKIGRNAESWTLDGLSLNDLSFYAGIEEGKPLFREVDKKNRPLPKFTASMLPTDIVSLFEGSYRVAAGTSLFEIGKVEPVIFAGKPGVHFSYSFVQQGEEVRRNGEGTGAIIGGKLYLVTFEAPVIYYFDRDIARYRTLVGTARVG
ncbi:MAG: hypothetical protein ACOYLK_12765 [Sphingomonas sp.]